MCDIGVSEAGWRNASVGPPACGVNSRRHRNAIAAPSRPHRPCENCPMDIEHINQIGSLLADLQDRTEQLRGYL
ncbi:MAG TPA: hypothetical protein PLB41_12935 [Rubrivivax sp.]|nr:hypothetical protein [Rubrivivax sp.]HPO18413.1 hypothetical protein [Rubrivivax sp.]